MTQCLTSHFLFKVPGDTWSKMHEFPQMFTIQSIQTLAHLTASKYYGLPVKNKGINCSFVTTVSYGKFQFSSTIGARLARICPILSLLHTFCYPS